MNCNLIQGTHGGTCWWNDVVYKEEESILRTKMNSFTDEEVELSNGEIWWYKVFFLVEVTNSSFWCFLNYNLNKNIQPNNLAYISSFFPQGKAYDMFLLMSFH